MASEPAGGAPRRVRRGGLGRGEKGEGRGKPRWTSFLGAAAAHAGG